MCFLNSMWAVQRPGEPLSSTENLTEHEVKQLRKKKHVAPRFPDDAPEDVFVTSSDSYFEVPVAAKPSWVSKFPDKLKKTFCLQAHVQRKLYEAHVNEKLARHRQIQIMKVLKLESPATSSSTAAPEESDSDDGAGDHESASGDGDDDFEDSDGSDELY
ncbi:hypothetical protein D1007_51860 [Hordeum vulgare]|nr:hypothetical protein D1007_51860 [Hordeum vulgare]